MTAAGPSLLGGVALIAAGGLLLLRAVGLVPDVPLGPVVLIAVGLAVLAVARRPATPDEQAATLALDGASEARVVLDHGAGSLRVGGGAGPGQLLDGRFTGGVVQRVDRTGDRLALTLQPDRDLDRWLARANPLTWDVSLGPDVPIDLEVRTGASRVRLDLSSLRVPSLRLKTGASDVEVVLPGHGPCSVGISAGAADVRVVVPPGVPAEVHNRSALTGFSIDQERFPRVNGAHRSPGYDTATDRVDIDIEGGVASFTVR